MHASFTSALFSPAPRSGARRHLHIALLGGLLAGLSACSSMQDIPAGSSLAEVEARYGAPNVECPLTDGSRRLVWTTQPMGQYAWTAIAAPDGTLGPVKQALTDAAFREVEPGVWNVQQLRCHFGDPADRSMVGLPGSTQHVWSYRYRQSGAWNSLMYFYVSPEGIVQRMHPGPDPMFDPIEWPSM